jgi:hypothetical protein
MSEFERDGLRGVLEYELVIKTSSHPANVLTAVGHTSCSFFAPV